MSWARKLYLISGLIFILSVIPLHSYCQLNVKVGTTGGVLFSHRELKMHDNSVVAKQIKISRDEEEPNWGSYLALSSMFIKNRWLLEIELVHTQTGYKNLFKNLLLGDPIGLPLNAAKVESFELHYIFSTIRLPLALGYTFGLPYHKKRHRLIPQIGVSNNILYEASTKGITSYDNGTNEEKYSYQDLSNYKQYTLSALSALTYMYEVDKFGIAAKALTSYSLTPIVSNSTLSEYEYFVTANITFWYRIK